MKINLNRELRKAIRDNTKVYDVIETMALEEITDIIIQDERENLASRPIDELEHMFDMEVDSVQNLPVFARQKLIDVKAKEWGLQSINMGLNEWLEHFTDYLDVSGFNELEKTTTAQYQANTDIADFENKLDNNKAINLI